MPLPAIEKNVLVSLSELAAMHRESWRGLAEVTEGIKQEQTAAMLREIGRRRLAASEAIKEVLKANSHPVPEGSSASAALHRFWIDLKSKLTDGSPYFVLGEVERGDEFLAKRYEEILSITEDTPVHDLILEQHQTLLGEINKIARHRERFKK